MKRFLSVDWDAVAGITAAVAALVLHFLHIVKAEALLTMMLLLLALLLLRDLRREHQQGRLTEHIERAEAAVMKMQAALQPPDAVLIGPSQLRSMSAQFARRSLGEMLYFNVCLLMFRPQTLFDALLRPAIENPRVTAIQFILDESEKERWRDEVMPKVKACIGSEKVQQPIWCPLRESVSFIRAETEPDGNTEILLSFWGEPFMARSTARDVPRYLFHVQSHSELVTRLGELERSYRFGR
jgi:hypothetical protein